jgi:phospho-N-acetylmuramoyl-pentapeptide-transferase
VTRALVLGAAASGVALLAGTLVVPWLRRLGLGKSISEEGPESHLAKAGTPTMGGLLIVGTIAVVTVPANLLGRESILLPLLVMAGMSGVGVLDDLLTIQGRERVAGHERIGMLLKAGIMIVLGFAVGAAVYWSLDVEQLAVPHFGRYEWPAALLLLAAAAVMAATTSAAAVADGLDGLLAGVMAFAFGAYGVIAGLQGQTYLAGFCFTVTGALLGFLWHNTNPASVFMGEAGALPLGAGLATVALMTGWWLVLPVVGIVLVAEILSDVVQIGSFRLTGRRVLRMAPLHIHFELSGWTEPQVVVRFWLIAAIGALAGVALVLTE